MRGHVFFNNLVTFQIKLNAICKCFDYIQNYCNEAIATGREAGRAEGYSETEHAFTPYSEAARDPGQPQCYHNQMLPVTTLTQFCTATE